MKRLLLALIAVVGMTGCVYLTPPGPFISASPPNPPTGQVVVLVQHGCCVVTVKNLGPTDVRNVKFKFTNYDKQYKDGYGRINYLPARETIKVSVDYDFDPNHPRFYTVMVDSFEVLPAR